MAAVVEEEDMEVAAAAVMVAVVEAAADTEEVAAADVGTIPRPADASRTSPGTSTSSLPSRRTSTTSTLQFRGESR